MQKLNKPWLYAILITAILVLTQAVFLFFPTMEARAETDPFVGYVTTPPGTVLPTDTKSIVIQLNHAVSNKIFLHIPGTSLGDLEMTNLGNLNYQAIVNFSNIPSGSLPINTCFEVKMAGTDNATPMFTYPSGINWSSCSGNPYTLIIQNPATNIITATVMQPSTENMPVSSTTQFYIKVTQASGFTDKVATNLKIWDVSAGTYITGFFNHGVTPQSFTNYTYTFVLKDFVSNMPTLLTTLTSGKTYRLDVFTGFGDFPSTANVTTSRNFVYNVPGGTTGGGSGLVALTVSFYNKPTAAPVITADSYQVQAITNIDAYIKFSLYQGSILVVDDQAYSGNPAKTRTYVLNTTGLVNGSYRMAVTAHTPDNDNAEDYYYFNLNRPVVQPAVTYSLKFYNMSAGVIGVNDNNPAITLRAQVNNFQPSEVYFNITGSQRSGKLTVASTNSNIYSTNWDLSGWPFGEYTISLSANTNLTFDSNTIKINYQKVTYDTVPETTTPVPAFEIKFDQSLKNPVSGDIPLSLTLNNSADRVEVQITSLSNSTNINKLYALPLSGSDNKKFSLVWQTKNFANTVYEVKAAAYNANGELLGSVKYGEIEVKNAVVAQPNPEPDKTSPPPAITTSPAPAVITPATASPIVTAPKTAPSIVPTSEPVYTTTVQQPQSPVVTDLCRQHGIENYYTCSIFLGLDKACQAQNITNKYECDDYLATLKLCSNQGIPEDKCQTALKLPLECRLAKVFTSDECKVYLYKAALPEACVKAGAATQDECQQIILNSSLPAECISQGIKTGAECKIFLAKKQSQKECAAANMISTESCKTYLFDKYGYEQNLDNNKKPIICQAKTITDEACNKLLIANYLPQACLAAGITNAEQCKFFIEQVDLPVECTTAGLKSRDECNSYMLDKFGPDICSQAGISAKDECRNYLFNKFVNEVGCTGQDKLVCQYAVENRYLGYIVAKQLEYKALREFAQKKRGLSVSASDFLSSDLTNNITPVKDANTKLKMVSSEQRLVMDSKDQLVQTSPVVLMIDTDGDGLPDDIEKSIGTDPNNPDSDGDGYYDGDEVRGGYNPLGQGKKETNLSPIEQAVMSEMTIGHPKASGVTSDNINIKSVDSQAGSKKGEEKYTLTGKGQPNSTVTLYLYSDLPLVALVKTDAYGNWQYEIDRPLQEGGHEVYATVNDNTGKVLEKSSPFQFFIKEAKAMSPQDFVANDRGPSNTKSMLNIYLAISGMIIMLGILLFMGIYYFNKSKPLAKY